MTTATQATAGSIEHTRKPTPSPEAVEQAIEDLDDIARDLSRIGQRLNRMAGTLIDSGDADDIATKVYAIADDLALLRGRAVLDEAQRD